MFGCCNSSYKTRSASPETMAEKNLFTSSFVILPHVLEQWICVSLEDNGLINSYRKVFQIVFYGKIAWSVISHKTRFVQLSPINHSRGASFVSQSERRYEGR